MNYKEWLTSPIMNNYNDAYQLISLTLSKNKELGNKLISLYKEYIEKLPEDLKYLHNLNLEELESQELDINLKDLEKQIKSFKQKSDCSRLINRISENLLSLSI